MEGRAGPAQSYGKGALMDVVLIGLVLTMLLVSPPLALVLLICLIAGKWMVLADMGRPRWAALIPFYADWQLCMGASGNGRLAACIVVTEVANALSQALMPDGLRWLAQLVLLAAVAANCVLCHKVARSFGRGIGLTVALALVPPVAYLVIPFGSAVYRGPVDA